MATVNLGVGDTGALQAALQQTARAIQQITREQSAATAATRAQTTATAAATGGFQNFAQGAQQTLQRVQGVANGIQSLVGHLGGRDRTAGLIGAVAGTTAQFASMGAMIGPGGAVAGGIVGLVAGLAGVVREMNDVEGAAAAAVVQVRNLAAANIAARGEARTARSILTGAGAGDISEADLETRAEEARIRAREAEDAIAAATRPAGGSRSFADPSEAGAALLEARLAPLRAIVAEQNAIVDGVRREIDARADAAREAEHMAGLQAAEAEATAAEAREYARSAEETAALDARHARERAAREHGGGGGAGDAAARARATAEANSEFLAAAAEVENRLTELRAEGDAERAADSIAKSREVEAMAIESANAEAAAHAVKADAQKAAAEEILASQREVSDALAEFSRGDVGSLESVIDAYHDLQNSAKRTGVEINRTGLLMSRGMTATGNSIADTIGSQMTGAFNEALGAWMDGSKSFVEAAEGMAKGVIKALTQEAIVQAVTEIARSIASFASQDYAGGIAHAGAAAAWAAVGIAAGAVGAATGAFGGGGAKDAGTSTKDMANADRERQRGGEPGTNVINVYADNLPVTQGDLDRVVTGMVRRGIERHGERFPGLSR